MMSSRSLSQYQNQMKADIVTKLAKSVGYSKETGFILHLEMPADEDANCDIAKVNWFDPIITVQIEDSFGQGNDVIRINPIPAKSLWDICSQGCKERFDPKEKERAIKKALAEGIKGKMGGEKPNGKIHSKESWRFGCRFSQPN